MRYRVYFNKNSDINTQIEVTAFDIRFNGKKKIQCQTTEDKFPCVDIDFGAEIQRIADDHDRTVYELACTEQLLILFRGVCWDGQLISKNDMKKLKESGYAVSANGWNMITPKGVLMLESLGLIHC
jgi:hypothetical protein